MSSDVRENPSIEQAGRTRRVDATERESRAVAEAAREKGWERPSFAKGLYLGRFDLDLVHPHPRADADDEARGEEFLTRLREVCDHIDGARIEREAQIPDEDIKALADIGAFGMKIPREYGGLGLTMSSYGKALMLVGSVHPSIGALLSAHQSIGVPEPVKLVGTTEQKQRVPAPLRRGRDLGVPAHRARRRVRPGPDGNHRDAHRRTARHTSSTG